MERRRQARVKQGLAMNKARACGVGICLLLSEVPGELRIRWTNSNPALTLAKCLDPLLEPPAVSMCPHYPCQRKKTSTMGSRNHRVILRHAFQARPMWRGTHPCARAHAQMASAQRHIHSEQTSLQLHAYTCANHGSRTKGMQCVRGNPRSSKRSIPATRGMQIQCWGPSVPCCPGPTLSNFIIPGLKWACNFHFFMGLSNLLQMAPAGCNAFLPRKLFFLFSSFLGWVTVLH